MYELKTFMSKRSETLLSKLEQKDHILRLARGARECGVSFEGFTAGLIDYVNDERTLDNQPLVGWWNLGGPYLGEYLTLKFGAELTGPIIDELDAMLQAVDNRETHNVDVTKPQ